MCEAAARQIEALMDLLARWELHLQDLQVDTEEQWCEPGVAQSCGDGLEKYRSYDDRPAAGKGQFEQATYNIKVACAHLVGDPLP